MPADPCPLCHGDGWRYADGVTDKLEPCDHNPKPQTPDAKERAAGENDAN